MEDKRRYHNEAICGRRENCLIFDDKVIESIAEKAADRAIEKLTTQIYTGVGKNVISKLIWLIGAIVVGAYLWLKGKGI